MKPFCPSYKTFSKWKTKLAAPHNPRHLVQNLFQPTSLKTLKSSWNSFVLAEFQLRAVGTVVVICRIIRVCTSLFFVSDCFAILHSKCPCNWRVRNFVAHSTENPPLTGLRPSGISLPQIRFLDLLYAQSLSPVALRACRLRLFAYRISLRSIRPQIRFLDFFLARYFQATGLCP